MNKLFLRLATLILLFSTITVEAGQSQGPPPPTTPLPGLPIDSNIILLFVALLLFGVYKIYSKQKTSI
jgi:hypothetical protein